MVCYLTLKGVYNTTDIFERPPTLFDLMSKVAAKIANKWEKIGILLGIPYSDIETISRSKDDVVICLAEVFDTWRRSGYPPYTWATIINVLGAELMGEVQLAKEVEQWVIQN